LFCLFKIPDNTMKLKITDMPTSVVNNLENLHTAQKLEKLRAAMASIHGETWEEIVAEQRPLIEGLMERDGHDNPIKAVMPVVKEMKRDGECPLLILAVAAEITLRQNAGGMAPGSAVPDSESKNKLDR
jgi:hypothetical protein